MARSPIGSGRVVGVVVVLAGTASAASAQSDNSVVRFEVREQGAPASAWTSNIEVTTGAVVEFRAVVTYVGSRPAVGIERANFQPTVSNWEASDSLLPFRAWGQSTVPLPPNIPASGVDLDSGQYGRINPHAYAGISSTNSLRAHSNFVANVNYMRIAQARATAWVGTGPTSGTEAANNFNGVAGLALGQRPPSVGGQTDPNFVVSTADVEVARFAIQVGGSAPRTLTIDAPIAGFSAATFETDIRGIAWYSTLQSSGNIAGLTWGSVTTIPATIRVPAPGALSVLGIVGVLGVRRRR